MVNDTRKVPDEHTGEYCEVKKHSSMGCAVITLRDVLSVENIASIKGEILKELKVTITNVQVQLKSHKNKETNAEVPTDIFVAWGRQIEKNTPVSVVALTEYFDERVKQIIIAGGASSPRMRTPVEDAKHIGKNIHGGHNGIPNIMQSGMGQVNREETSGFTAQAHGAGLAHHQAPNPAARSGSFDRIQGAPFQGDRGVAIAAAGGSYAAYQQAAQFQQAQYQQAQLLQAQLNQQARDGKGQQQQQQVISQQYTDYAQGPNTIGTTHTASTIGKSSFAQSATAKEFVPGVQQNAQAQAAAFNYGQGVPFQANQAAGAQAKASFPPSASTARPWEPTNAAAAQAQQQYLAASWGAAAAQAQQGTQRWMYGQETDYARMGGQMRVPMPYQGGFQAPYYYQQQAQNHGIYQYRGDRI